MTLREIQYGGTSDQSDSALISVPQNCQKILSCERKKNIYLLTTTTTKKEKQHGTKKYEERAYKTSRWKRQARGPCFAQSVITFFSTPRQKRLFALPKECVHIFSIQSPQKNRDFLLNLVVSNYSCCYQTRICKCSALEEKYSDGIVFFVYV